MEEFEYFIDNKKVTREEFEEELGEAAKYVAQEDGIYYEWINQNLPTRDYEEFIEGVLDKFEKELDELGVSYSSHKFERMKVYSINSLLTQ